MDELQRLNTILERNKDKPFVQRILNRDQYPVLQNPDGSHSTHSMAWAEVDNGGGIAYPTVVMGDDKQLRRLEPSEAIEHARKTGNYILFDKAEDAFHFSTGYKRVWGADPSKY